uniref:Uncharacterized protein n=1 Tax=viral metagenome TaxID=1070528 RepID=A0A6C0C2Z6_9ZZZZ
MSRFERRKTTSNGQRGGSIYAGRRIVSSQTQQPQQQINQTNQNQQLLTVIKKHDELLTRLLKRFNDLESTLNTKIESIIEVRIKEFNEEFEAKLNSININSINDSIGDVAINEENIKDVNNNSINEGILNNANAGDINSLLQNINSDVVKKNDFDNFALSIQNSLNTFTKTVLNKNNDIVDEMNVIKSVISQMNYSKEVVAVTNEYEKNKDKLFYKEETDSLNVENIKNVVSEDIQEKKVGSTLSISLDDLESGQDNSPDDKNIELEIVEN